MSRLEEFSLTWKSSQNTSTLTHISKGAKVCSILGPCQGIYSFSEKDAAINLSKKKQTIMGGVAKSTKIIAHVPVLFLVPGPRQKLIR